ncbi:MAG: ribonuclease H-like domain-containing protein [candidate division KSB1 bacterium]|nr:ribonuclease H-like domain-containing protein [candidate division KSB1 bacterium]MDZ7300506.1 ribonuclease H-like domain-containing protein [candidate division KSB1 bacterium]MDZ7309645.1 ribonuclease H-like domain-containing protein [candidate division KSB1 bacterium]
MTLKEKLRELDRSQAKIITPESVRKTTPLDDLLGGNEQDGCFVVERRFALHYPHGAVRLASLHEISSAALAIAGKDERLVELDLAHALFLDTETTGLAGGTGTVAFLLGAGCFEGEEFVVRQYFLRQPCEEVAMLKRLQTLMEECKGLVTFNGKSFDIPLLRTRAVLHRLPVDFDRVPHFDVLHAARRLWKECVESCSLGELENNVLQLRRSQDIPGALIPQIYFDFLRYGDATQLPEVFAHNRQDIVSMATLLVRIAQLVQYPMRGLGAAVISPQELRRVAVLYRQLGNFAASARLFEELLQQLRSTPNLEDHLALGLCYKSQRRYDKANQIWREVIDRQPFHPLPYIELAKYFEHREGATQSALEWVERALRNLLLSEELNLRDGWLPYKNDLLHRKNRLLRKLARQPAINPDSPHWDPATSDPARKE